MNISILSSSITGKKIILPFYHVVDDNPLPYIQHLYKVKTISEFCNDLDFLLRYFQPVDINTLYNLHINGDKPRKPVFHLTFDDGLKQIDDIIAPVLLKKGIPATFFVNTGFVDNQALFYRYHASLAIEDSAAKGRLTPELKEKILSTSYQGREELFNYYDSEKVNLFLTKEKPYLSTQQIIKLSNQGFTFGAHSVDHPYYSEISLEQQLRQARESIRSLYAVINQHLKLFAFPFTDAGVPKKFFEEIEQDVNLTFGTANLKNDSIKFNIQRIPAEDKKNKPIKKIIRNQYVRYILKGILNKNHIIR